MQIEYNINEDNRVKKQYKNTKRKRLLNANN